MNHGMFAKESFVSVIVFSKKGFFARKHLKKLLAVVWILVSKYFFIWCYPQNIRKSAT